MLARSQEEFGFLAVAAPHEQLDAVGSGHPRLDASCVVTADDGVNLVGLEHGPPHFGIVAEPVCANHDQIVLLLGVCHWTLDSNASWHSIA